MQLLGSPAGKGHGLAHCQQENARHRRCFGGGVFKLGLGAGPRLEGVESPLSGGGIASENRGSASHVTRPRRLPVLRGYAATRFPFVCTNVYPVRDQERRIPMQPPITKRARFVSPALSSSSSSTPASASVVHSPAAFSTVHAGSVRLPFPVLARVQRRVPHPTFSAVAVFPALSGRSVPLPGPARGRGAGRRSGLVYHQLGFARYACAAYAAM